ncbi:hypothetical protein RJ640_008054 [Escallonia rubra]|uniref:Uncharacterized protein n=1 Tax=Escallonia rubra TaxID=112253 RepID=A0AA88UGI1_9ASTE|nr:hypothetical protein RJ640_008054 [Escallonia rubra]
MTATGAVADMVCRMQLSALSLEYAIGECRRRRIIKTADDLESYQLEHCIRSRFIVEIINKREKMIDGEAESSGNDFLGLLVKASNYADDRNRITVDDVVDECKTSTLVDMKLR